LVTDEIKSNPQATTRAGHNNGYFDWFNLEEMTIRISSVGIINIPVPWLSGSSAGSNIPSHWIDSYAGTTQSIYSKENGWELVYSNINEPIAKKYFALYNKYTGIIRFFMYAYSTSAQEGTSSCFWGIKSEGSTSLFNFVGSIATPLTNVPETPAFVTSTPGELYLEQFVCGGYQENQWYGFEMECAYDPNILPNTNFRLNGWATNLISHTGEASTTGNINGTITSKSESSGIDFNLSNMFNTNNNVTVKSSGEDAVNKLATEIDNGVKKNDSFFKNIWNKIQNNIESGISTGVKDGLKALITSGTSEAVKVASGLFNSMLGISSPTVNTVDLSVSMKTTFTIESSQSVVGYGGVSSFPIAGYSTIDANAPLYNKPLGVWSLKRAPKVSITLYMSYGQSGYGYGTYDIDYNIVGNITEYISLNPEVANEFYLRDCAFEFLSKRYIDIPPFCEIRSSPKDLAQLSPTSAYGIIDGKSYYYLGHYINGAGVPIVNWGYPINHCGVPLSLPTIGMTDRILIKVSFWLENKENGKKYYHYKYFYPEISNIIIYED